MNADFETGDVASETGIRYQPVLPISRDFFISMRCGVKGIEESYLFDCSTLSRGMSWIPAELEDSLSIFFVLLPVIWDSRLICMAGSSRDTPGLSDAPAPPSRSV
ncbi:hypothetical protein AAC387_Pa01g3987 [Persea americana]